MIETESIIIKTLSEALETMAFMEPMPLEEELEIPARSLMGEIGFRGPKNGTLQILAGVDFAATLAENIAALDDADDSACIDALQELCNVTCGLLLPELASTEDDQFDMTIPQTHWQEDPSHWTDFVAEETSYVLNVEGFLVAAKLIIDN
jgi:chemotaxis protein CheY-P-specific phosphatase CheC